MPGSDDHFLINPYGLLYEEVTASSLVKIDAAGNKVEPSDREVNSGGFAIPSAIHMARPELGCVLHTHTIAGCAVSMQKHGLLPLNQHALQVIGDVAYHDYEGTGRNPEERARLLADFGDRHIMVLRNHGLLIVGTSIAEAFVATYRMERACAMQLAFQQSGAEFNPIDDEVVSAAFDNANGAERSSDRIEWLALLRKLDRDRPDLQAVASVTPARTMPRHCHGSARGASPASGVRICRSIASREFGHTLSGCG